MIRVPRSKNFWKNFSVKAARIDDRKLIRINSIRINLRSSILGSFHARNYSKNFWNGALESLKNLFRKKPLVPSKKRSSSTETLGEHYDLKSIYDLLNDSYFENKLNLEITWFGSAERQARRHRKLGLFCFHSNQIKIHRLLDRPLFPPYFISYVVYHEMLHSVCPPVKGKKGRFRIHHSDFKAREKEFAEYANAKRWEQENKKLFFSR